MISDALAKRRRKVLVRLATAAAPWTFRDRPVALAVALVLAGLLARAEDEAEQAADRLAWLRRAMKRMLVGPSCDELEAAAAKDCS